MTGLKHIRRAELKMVARALGWVGKSSDSPDTVYAWFNSRGISVADVLAKHAELRRVIQGKATTGTAPVINGLSREQVQRMIDEALVAAQLNTPTSSSGGGQAVLSADDIEALNKRIHKMVRDAVRDSEPRAIVMEYNTKVGKMTERQHPMFEKVLRLVRAGEKGKPGLNVMLVGPAGCGKTRLGEQLAAVLGLRFGALSCSAGASESHLTGYLIPVTAGGAFAYVPSEFVECYEQGDSVFLLDEIDACDPNMLLVINAALANGSMHIPQRHKKPLVTRGKNCIIIAAANTFGHGADMIYVGRNQLDAATLDRFYVVTMDYDEVYEAELCGVEDIVGNIWTPAAKPTDAEIREIGQWIFELRRKVKASGLRRVISTRMFQKAIAARNALIPFEQIKVDLMAGWKRDELAKVGL